MSRYIELIDWENMMIFVGRAPPKIVCAIPPRKNPYEKWEAREIHHLINEVEKGDVLKGSEKFAAIYDLKYLEREADRARMNRD